MKTLLENCYLLIRKDNGYNVLKNAYLGYENDTIIYISENKPSEKYDVYKDMTNKLVMPGLVNAHGHTAMTLVRGLGSGLPLQEWLTTKIFPTEDKMNAKDIGVGTLAGCLEMIRSGTTLFSDMYFFSYMVVEAVAKSGLKANISKTGITQSYDQKMEDCERYHTVLEFSKTINKNAKTYTNPELIKDTGNEKLSPEAIEAIQSDRIRGDLCLHSEYLTNEAMAVGFAQENKTINAAINIHVSETKKEHEECKQRHNGRTPIEYFNDCGVFNSGYPYCAHCVWVTDNDLKIMAKKGVSLVHNPSSNMKLASGVAPIVKALKMGVNVALGTDGCASNNNLDMFEEMHIAALLQTGTNLDPCCISVDNIIDMATINGAKAMGRFDTGKLEVGYKADLIALDLNAPHLTPTIDIPALLVYSAASSDVCLTIVDGKTLYENGEFLTLNKKEILENLQHTAEKLLN